MATTSITSETDLNTAIGDANSGAATTGAFANSVTETAAPTPISATTAAPLTLDGVNYTLTGDGTDAVLTVAVASEVIVENLNIANTGTAAGVVVGTGSTLEFASDDSTATTTISAAITGAGAVVFDTTDAVADATILNAANTYTGTTTIEGYVALGAKGSIASSAAVVDNGTLDISGATSTAAVNQLSGAGDIYVGNTTLVVSESAVTQASDTTTVVPSANTFTGVISDAAGATKTTGGLTLQAGTLELTGAETYTGSTKIYGDLVLSGTASLADTSNVSLKLAGAKFDITGETSAVTIAELTGVAGTAVKMGATDLTIDETLAATFSGTISGTGALTIGGTAELYLAGASNYSGATIISEGATLGISGAGSLTTSGVSGAGAFDIASATSAVTVNDLTTSGTVTLGAERLILTGTSTPAGVISGSGSVQVGATTTTSSSAALTVSATETYSGSTVVYGTLTLGEGGSIEDSSNVSLKVSGASLNVVGAATDDVTNYVTIQELTGVAGTSVVLGDNTLSVTETTAATFGGVISDGDDTGSLMLSGPATLTLTGANTYTGNTTINAGSELALSGAGSIANSYVTDGGVFDISGVNTGTSVAGSISVTVNALQSLDVGDTNEVVGSVVLGNNTLIVDGDDHSEFDGVISGTGALTITSGSELELDGANTYTGATTIASDSVLYLENGGSIASTSIVNNGEIYVSESTLTVTGTLTGTGELYLDAATLDISKASGPVTISGTLEAFSGTIDGATVNASVILGSNTLIVAAGGDFAGVISGTGSVQVTGGEFVVSGAQTYTGSTVVNGGDLVLDGATLASSNVSLKTGSELFVESISDTVTSMTINELTGQADTIVFLAENLVINETIAASFSGTFEGSTNLTLGGTAVLTLAGDNVDFTGTTTINAGASLALSGVGSISNSTALIDNGTFTVGAAGTSVQALSGAGVVKMVTYGLTDTLTSTSTTSTFSGAIHGASALTVAGTDTTSATTHLILSGASDYSGGTTITGGTLEVASAHAVGTGAITFATTAGSAGAGSNGVLVIDNAALTGAGTATESFANTITGNSAYDIIDLSGLSYSAASPATISLSTSNQVVVTEGGVSVTLAITGVTSANIGAYHAYEDAHGGTYIVAAATQDTTHYHP